MSRVILVDDDEIIADLVTDAFVAAGHGIGWLQDGQSALEVLRRRAPDLLILDCNMPGLSGVDMLRILRKSAQFYDLPILMLTGRQSETDERIVRYEGASDYLRKPFDPATLVGRAEALIAGKHRWD